MPVENVGALLRTAFHPNRVQSFPDDAACDDPVLAAIASTALAKPIERAVERRRIELTVPVFSERGEVADRACDRGRRQAPVTRLEAPNRPAAVVAVEVAPLCRRHCRAAIDVAAGDRAAGGVRVDKYRRDRVSLAEVRLPWVVDGPALEAAPAVVREPADPRRVAVV